MANQNGYTDMTVPQRPDIDPSPARPRITDPWRECAGDMHLDGNSFETVTLSARICTLLDVLDLLPTRAAAAALGEAYLVAEPGTPVAEILTVAVGKALGTFRGDAGSAQVGG